MKRKTHTLNPKMRAYCLARCEGFTQSESYLKAGYRPSSKKNSKDNACALEKVPQVAAYLAKLREESFTKDALTLQEKRSIIGRMVRSAPAEVDASSPLAQSYIEEVSPDGRIRRKVTLPDKARLLQIDNDMAGDYFGTKDTLASNPFALMIALTSSGLSQPMNGKVIESP